jgi:N-glycosylase/DNA lyase
VVRAQAPALPEEMRALYEARRMAIRARLAEYAAVPRSQWFYELCYCILTPQSSARNAAAVQRKLEERSFFTVPFDPTSLLRDPAHYIRFHITKGKRLLKAREQWPLTAEQLHSPTSNEEKRSWLVANVDGMSLKEASHFLRNIGARNLAILDRHIFTHLLACGVMRRMPRTITQRRYLEIETKFKKFSLQRGIAMDELDLLFWSRQTGEILK